MQNLLILYIYRYEYLVLIGILGHPEFKSFDKMPLDEPLLSHAAESKADYPDGDFPRPPEDGLSTAEAQRLLAIHGYNELAEEERNPLLEFLGNFWGPMPIMIWLAIVSWLFFLPSLSCLPPFSPQVDALCARPKQSSGSGDLYESGDDSGAKGNGLARLPSECLSMWRRVDFFFWKFSFFWRR